MNLRTVLALDFACALAGAAGYALLFDVVVERLSLPRAVVQVQLGANVAYAAYGGLALLSGTRNIRFLGLLCGMNFLYAGVCAVGAVTLQVLSMTSPWGALLLVVESLLIAALASFELRFLRSFKPTPQPHEA